MTAYHYCQTVKKKLIQALALCALLTGAQVCAADLNITTIADSGVGSLRAAMTQAQAGDRIVFTVAGTITLQSPLPIIDKSLEIIGPKASFLRISGDKRFRVFFVDAPRGKVRISKIIIADGLAQGGHGGHGSGGGGGGLGAGGGIFVGSGDVTLTEVEFSGNAAAGGFGGTGTNKTGGGGGGGLGGIGGWGSADAGGGGGGLYGRGGDATIGGQLSDGWSAGGGGGLSGNGGNGGSFGGGGGGGIGLNGQSALLNRTIYQAVGGKGQGGGGDGGNYAILASNGGYGGGGGGAAVGAQTDSIYQYGRNGAVGGKFGGGGGGVTLRGGSAGEYGGGGGAGSSQVEAANGGHGGFGGGGGGSYHQISGSGGFGAGSGGVSGYPSPHVPGPFGGSGAAGRQTGIGANGGGGAALGGAVFVRGDNGATVTFIDSFPDLGTVTPGGAGGVKAQAGTAAGPSIFLLSGTNVFSVNSHSGAAVISGLSAWDQKPAHLVKTGFGTLQVKGLNLLYGTTRITEGTVELQGSLEGTISAEASSTLAGNGSASSIILTQGSTLSPGIVVGNIYCSTMAWRGAVNYHWQLLDANGAEGSGYDSFRVNGSLDLSQVTQVNLNLWSISDSLGTSGSPLNFTTPQAFVIGRANGGIIGFDAAKFTVRTEPYQGSGGFPGLDPNLNISVVQVGNAIVLRMGVPSISWATPADITFGTVLSANPTSGQLNATANIPGTFAYNFPVGTVLPAGTTTLTATFTPANYPLYQIMTHSVVIHVRPSTQQIIFNPLPVSTFGDLPFAVSATASSGLPVNFSVLSGPATVAGNQVTITGAGTVTLQASQGGSSNYTPAVPVTRSFIVQKATPKITWNAPAAISYGTALGNAQLNPITGVPGTFEFTPVSGSVLSVGTHTLSALFSPADGSNYNMAGASTTLTVSKSSPTITWDSPTPIIYGTPLSTAQLNPSSSVAGTFEFTPASGSILPTGTHTLSALFSPTDGSKYNMAEVHATITVSKATPEIVWNPTPITHGTSLGAAQLNPSSSVPGTFEFTPASGSILSVGTHTLSALFSPADGSNYNMADASATLTVAKVVTIPDSPIGMTLVEGDVTWEGDGSLTWQLFDATGRPGVGYDLLKIQGNLDLSGSYGFQINLSTLSSLQPATAGDAIHFNNKATPQSWTLVQTSDGIIDFQPDAIRIITSPNGDSSGFSNPMGGNHFELRVSGSDLTLHFLAGPAVATLGASKVDLTTATMKAEVNPGGAETQVYFEYGLSKNYTASTETNSLGSGSALIPVSITTSGLSTGKLYHFRAVAMNSSGTVKGTDLTFTLRPGVAVDFGTPSLQVDRLPEPRVLRLTVFGPAGRTYRIETSPSLNSPVWSPLLDALIDDDGEFVTTVTNSPTNPLLFYRAILPETEAPEGEF